ncbi:hypothetical protein F5Y10DRAFT_279886 [Nemania abortiva]|nr:hypothetical protein F5Y10DRAFT_279886 [Nemania abortiva]
MEHSMEPMEPLLDFHSNLPEMLAVDLEQSSDIFRSKQLTAGAPAPGLADDGERRRYSIPHGSSYLVPLLPPGPDNSLPNSVSLQTIHHKYSDIFAPLDFNPPKRGSISSSDSSVDLEPPSISTREESVLTVDTWLESEKQPLPTYLHITPTSDDYTAQISWIDLEADDTSPTTQRRRSSMTDFPKYMQQPWGTNDIGMRTMSLRSQLIDGAEAPMTPINKIPPGYPLEIPKRRSSLGQQQLARGSTWQETYHNVPQYTSPAPPYDESHSTNEHDAGTSFFEDEPEYNFRDSMDRPSMTTDRDLGIASDQVGVDEWLESDLAHYTHEDQPSPRPLGSAVQHIVESYVTSFPEALLLCNSQLVDSIRDLSHGLRFNTEGPKSDRQATPVHPSNNQQHPKPRKWKLLGSSTNTAKNQDQFDAPSVSSKQPWDVIRKVFPRGGDGHCDALYAYLLAYNYITSLCVRSTSHPTDPPKSVMPRTVQRPGTGNSADYADFDDEDMYLTHAALPKRDKPKWPELLGIEGEEDITGAPLSGSAPPSRGSGSRTPNYTGLRNIPAFLFSGVGQGQRQNESRDLMASSATTHAGHPTGLSRPTTPAMGRAGMAPRGSGQAKQLAALRYGLAMCCARLTVTLQRTDPNSTEHKPDADCRVNPWFMRSLCENVRSTEEGMARQ